MEPNTQYHVTFMNPVRVKLQGVSVKVIAIDAIVSDHSGAAQDFQVHALYLETREVRFTGTLSIMFDNVAGYIAQAFEDEEV